MGKVFTTGGMEGNKDAYGRGITSDHNRGKYLVHINSNPCLSGCDKEGENQFSQIQE